MIAPLHQIAGQKFINTFHQRVRRRHIIQAEKAIQPVHGNSAWNLWLGKDTFQLRAKIKFAFMLTIVERLNAHAVARQHQPPLRLNPDGNGKHSAQARETFIAPLQKGMQDNFGIATGFKLRAVGFQFAPQLMVVEDFAVENHNHVAVRTDQRLVTAAKVLNAQTRCAQ